MPRPRAPSPSSRAAWLVSAGLFAGTVLLFTRALGYDFLNYDDPSYLTNNPQVQAGLTWEGVVWAFTAPTDYWHPLTWLSHMLDWQLFGPHAAGHRAVSVLWHATNAVLVFHVLRRLTGASWTAAFAAALFAWHPLRVESVVWVTERKDVMSGCFFLLTLQAYAGYAERCRAGQPARARYALTLALFLAGLMCKPMLVSLPLVLLILDAWPLRRFTAAPPGSWWVQHRRVVLEKLPFVLLSGAVSVLTVVIQRKSGAFLLDLPLSDRLGNAVVSVARYLGKFFWPADLVVCYPHPGAWPLAAVLAALALAAALTVGAVARRRTQPWQLAGWLWFLFMLLPALGIAQVGPQAMADRYTYLPVLGWELALLWTLRGMPWSRAAAAGGAAIVLAGAAALTWRQQGVWRNSVALFEHALAVDDRNEFAHAFLGYTFLEQDRFDDADREAGRALALQPRNEIARYTRALVLAHRNQLDAAAAGLHALLADNPRHLLARHVHGRLLLELGRPDEAIADLRVAYAAQPDFRQSDAELAVAEIGEGRPATGLRLADAFLAIDPADAGARFIRARALAAMQRPAEALAEVAQILRQQPDHAAAHVLAGLLLLGRRDAAAALPHFSAAVARTPDDPAALIGLGRAQEQLGRREAATATFSRALVLGANVADVHRTWADTLARRGDFAGAIAAYEKAMALRPDDAETHAALGFALALSGRRPEAAAQWREALRLRPDFPGLRERLEHLPP